MIKLIPTKQQIKEAKKLFDFGKLNNSVTKGKGNLAGALGEILVRDYYNGKQENTFDYDLILNNKKVDVKTKRFSNMQTPNDKWSATLFGFNINQKCDWYCFVGVSNDYKTSYIYGFKQKDNFYKEASFGKKGEVDPNGSGNNWTFRYDTYYLSIKNLIL